MQDALKDLQNEFKELEDEFKASVAAVETQDASGLYHTTVPLAYVSCGSAHVNTFVACVSCSLKC